MMSNPNSNKLLIDFIELYKSFPCRWKETDPSYHNTRKREQAYGKLITYETPGMVQIRFLKLLSQEAYQNFTYSCINSIGWFNSVTKDYKLAVKLKGINDDIFSSISNSPIVLKDECKSGKAKGETVLEIRLKNLDKLPIIDFSPHDFGQPNQAFGFQVGPMCFK